MKQTSHPNYSLTKLSKEEQEEQLDDHPVNPLPRAVIRRNCYFLLDGEWQFALDTDDIGLATGWYLAHDYPAKAIWPGSVETHMEKVGAIGRPWQDRVIVWYEREFPLPNLGDDDPADNLQLQLTFGACGYETQVWLNGFPLRTIDGEEVHVGEYTSFSYELDRRMMRPINRITVRISSTMSADIPRGKQESVVYKRGGIWYQTYTGGVRSVWLENVDRNRLRSRVGVVSFVEDNLIRFNFTTRIHDPGVYKIRLNIYNRHEPETIATDEYSYFWKRVKSSSG